MSTFQEFPPEALWETKIFTSPPVTPVGNKYFHFLKRVSWGDLYELTTLWKLGTFQERSLCYPNNIHYKLSAGGAKGAVETTPKCTSLNYVLAPQSCPLGLAGFSLVE